MLFERALEKKGEEAVESQDITNVLVKAELSVDRGLVKWERQTNEKLLLQEDTRKI